MISYYKSKHPGLIIYIALTCVSVLAFLFIDINAKQVGVLSLLWGVFIFMRVLSLYEVEEHAQPMTRDFGASKQREGGISPLAYDLLNKMKNNDHSKRGVFAINSLGLRLFFWFAIATIYLSYRIFLTPLSILAQEISPLFIIGAAFLAGITYAYSNQATTLIFTIFGSLSCLLMIKLSINYEFDYFNISQNEKIAIWILIWSMVSVFWVRLYPSSRKKYVLYQCE